MSTTLRCRGCGRGFGVAHKDDGLNVYCSPACALDGPLGENEERDDILRVMHKELGLSYLQIGVRMDLSRQRVQQVVTSASTSVL